MKIKLDENLPFQPAVLLKRLAHEVHTLHDQHLIGHPDRTIWEAAPKGVQIPDHSGLGFLGCATIRSWVTSRSLLVRLRSPTRAELVARVMELFQHEDVDAWISCFVVATERKIRVLRPGPTEKG